MAIEAPEGIVFSSSEGVIKDNDLYGTLYKDSEVRGLSKSQIETVDLLSEGPINGLASGIWHLSGTLGNIGWTTGTFSGFKFPSDFTGVGFLRSIYWNEVPVLNDDKQFNFQNINVKQTEGKPNGEVIQVLSPFQTVSRTIGERLRAGSTNARFYRILNKDCRGVVVNIKFPGLAKTDTEGRIGRLRIDYSIQYKPLFNDKISEEYLLGKNEFVFGKIVASNGYIRTTRIDFSSNFFEDKGFMGWEVKIERSTPESTTALEQSSTFVESITEIQGNVYTFPNSAMVRSLFDAEYFQTIPERAFDTELLKVKIPGNYNPRLKTYATSGFAITNSGWNGEFATGKHYTDNPAWCYYDLLTSPRYGLGKHIDSNLIDTTSLYEISKYCDTLVNDGFGGLEPRFTCNVWFTSREDAYNVVNDMASIFRGLTYYANGSIFATQDSPKSPVLTFTNANVEEGNFNYSTSPRKSRHSIAIIRYNDPKNFYKPAIEYVEDFDAIRKYGIREVGLTAFGCASRGQAIRLGRWALLSDNLEPESIDFVTSIGEAVYIKPGDVFKIADANRKSKRYGGRTVAIKNIAGTGSDVILDYKIDTEPTVEYKISFLTPSFNYDPTQVSGLNSEDYSNIRKSFIQEFHFSGAQSTISGSKTVVNLYSGFNYSDYHVTGGQVWTMELSDRYSNYTGARYFSKPSEDYYRVINITEADVHKYKIEGLQYNSQKYIEIESGLLFHRNILNENRIPASPYGLRFNVFDVRIGDLVARNAKRIDYSFLIDDTTNVDSYRVYAKLGDYADNKVPDSQFLIDTLPTYTTQGSYRAIRRTGLYNFRVYASNDSQGILSPSFASGGETIYSYESIRETIISSLQISNVVSAAGESIDDTFYSGSSSNNYSTVLSEQSSAPIFTWQVGAANPFLIDSGIKYRATIRPYDYEFSNSRMPTDTIVYQETGLVEPTFTFTLDKNVNASGGPYRDYQVIIEAHDEYGRTSAGNVIGVSDNGWNAFPNGYDILTIKNLRPSGYEFADNTTSEDWGLVTQAVDSSENYGLVTEAVDSTGNYGLLTDVLEFSANGYIGPNGDIIINQFTDANWAGGYIYTSTGTFDIAHTGLTSLVNNNTVRKSLFYFDSNSPYIYHPNAAFNLKNFTSGFVSISFFDVLDRFILNSGVDISTGLYMSQNTVFFNDSYIGRLTLGEGTNGTAQTIKQIRLPTGSDFGINWDENVMLFSGTISGFTSVIYANVFEGATVNWLE